MTTIVEQWREENEAAPVGGSMLDTRDGMIHRIARRHGVTCLLACEIDNAVSRRYALDWRAAEPSEARRRVDAEVDCMACVAAGCQT